MNKNILKSASIGALLAIAASGAFAQTPATSTPPDTVGVTSQTAAEANQKAVPRSNVGTLVRTDSSAATRAGALAADGKAAVTPAAAPTPAQEATATRTDMRKTTRVRKARADRN